jgi:hypothetical protein
LKCCKLVFVMLDVLAHMLDEFIYFLQATTPFYALLQLN